MTLDEAHRRDFPAYRPVDEAPPKGPKQMDDATRGAVERVEHEASLVSPSGLVCAVSVEPLRLLLAHVRRTSGAATGWLIERGGEWYRAFHTDWAVKQALDPTLWQRENWTKDANLALRFARREDAENLIRCWNLQKTTTTEHQWVGRALASETE